MTSTTTARDANLAAQGRLGDLLGAGDIEHLDEVFAADVLDHDPADGQAPGVEGIKQFWRDFTTAFPDLQADPVVVSADDEFVTVVLDIQGTHQGDFLGHGATGKAIRVRGIQTGRFVDGKLVERWGSTDQMGIMQQLGLA